MLFQVQKQENSTNIAKDSKSDLFPTKNNQQKKSNDITKSNLHFSNTHNLCKCSLKCSLRIKMEDRLRIFNDFCNIENYSMQNSYLTSCVKNIPIKRRRRRGDPRTFYKQNTFIYTIKLNKKNLRICKTAFMNVHGLQRNRGRVNSILASIKHKQKEETLKSKENVPEEPITPLYYACDLDELITTGNLVTVYMVSLEQDKINDDQKQCN